AETGNFTRAAEREQVAQPSLSQQIMKLEEELGVRLFDRLGRSVRLTDVGQVFLKRARTVLGELRAAREDVAVRLMDRLRAGLIDLAVIALPIRGTDVESSALRTERLYAILPKEHHL